MELSRRSLVSTTAAMAAVASAPVARAAGAASILHRGAEFPVTRAWHQENTVPFPWLANMTRAEVDAVRLRLLRKSEQTISERIGDITFEEIRALPEATRHKLLQTPLSVHELAMLRACDAHMGVRKGIDMLAGRPMSDFGFEHVDQINHNMWHGFPCGCRLNVVFDRNRRFHDWSKKTNERQHHPHYPAFVCAAHSAHARDLETLHQVVMTQPSQAAKALERA